MVLGGILNMIPTGELVSPSFRTIYIFSDHMITYIIITKQVCVMDCDISPPCWLMLSHQFTPHCLALCQCELHLHFILIQLLPCLAPRTKKQICAKLEYIRKIINEQLVGELSPYFGLRCIKVT